MKEDIHIIAGSKEEHDFIRQQLSKFNISHIQLNQPPQRIALCYVIKSEGEKIIGGINASFSWGYSIVNTSALGA